MPVTAALAYRAVALWGQYGLQGTREFLEYHDDVGRRISAAHAARAAHQWDDIPVTVHQPEGRWRHQKRAFWFAYHLDNSMLAITMGGGKTKVAIDLMLNWNARDILIISPLAACEDAWIPQLETHIPVDRGYSLAPAFSGSSKKRMDAAEAALLENRDHRIVLINHEAFWREPYRSFVLGRRWDLVICDEIHREKSAGSKQSVALYRLASRARRRLGLTGTPMPHSPLDVYGQYRFLDQGIYGTNKAKFDQEYAVWGGYKLREIYDYKNQEDLHEKFYSIAILIDDSEQGLPAVSDLVRSVKLTPKTKETYRTMEKDFITQIKEGKATAANAGVKLLRLHQLACGILTVGKYEDKKITRISTEKIQALEDIVRNELKEGEPYVVFTRFDLDTQSVAQALGCSQLSGRANELQAWKKGKTQGLVAQIQAAKEGIDLTRAAVAIFYSTGISLGDYDQCRKRLHRPPQERMVRFIHLLASGTKDVSTMRALRERRDVVKELLLRPTADMGDAVAEETGDGD